MPQLVIVSPCLEIFVFSFAPDGYAESDFCQSDDKVQRSVSFYYLEKFFIKADLKQCVIYFWITNDKIFFITSTALIKLYYTNIWTEQVNILIRLYDEANNLTFSIVVAFPQEDFRQDFNGLAVNVY